MFELILAFILLIGSYFLTRIIESNHYKSIRKRELDFLQTPFVNFDCGFDGSNKDFDVKLVSGSVVIASGYFKNFMAGLRAFFGGPVKSYESLLDRARREAKLRMQQQAKKCDGIMNVRVQTTTIEKGTIEVLAYATAIYHKNN